MISIENLQKKLKDLNIQKFRSKQIIHAIYKECKTDFDDIHILPKQDRIKLKENIKTISLEPTIELTSKNKNTEKILFQTKDNYNIETVLMRYKDGRNTVCVSVQVGCKLGCKFCATGKLGFFRDLTDEEITDQVLYINCKLKKENKRVTNIVFMGMGEPFLNYKNTLSAIRTLNNKETFNIGARSITVSTSGIVEGIKKFTEENMQVNLAVSLHAPTQEIREKIMPISKKYSLEELMKSIEEYIKKTNRRVSYEYIMLKDINDSEENARELASLVKNQLCHINLIPYNDTATKNMSKSNKNKIHRFKEILEQIGITTTIRVSLGQDIQAACGQLANKSKT